MGPTPNPKENNIDRSSERNYEEDGWYVGYEVQMEGLGVVNVYGQVENDSGSDSEGYVGRDTDSEDENAPTRRAGYMTVPSTNEIDSDDACDVKVSSQEMEDVAGPSKITNSPVQNPFNTNISPPVQKAFQNALENAASVHLSNKDFQVPSSNNDIHLSQDQIEAIKSSMSGFKLANSEWADEKVDKEILSFLTKKPKD